MVKLSRKYRQIVKIMLDRTHIEPSKDQLYWQIHALVLVSIPESDYKDYKILKKLRRCYL